MSRKSRKNERIHAGAAAGNDGDTSAVAAFLREELRLRYQPEQVRRFPELDALSAARVNELREFFLSNVYPPPERRARIEAGFEHLQHLLRSPARLRPLLRALAGSLWRLGRKLPAALAAGRGVVDAFERVRGMEGRVLAALPDGAVTRAAMLQALAAFSNKEIDALIGDLTGLLQQFSQVDMLAAMVDAIGRCKEAMDAYPQTYPEVERAGVALALETVSCALDLFRDIPAAEFALIIRGTALIERNWHDSIREEAKANSA